MNENIKLISSLFKKLKIDHYFGVPDSVLKNLLNEIFNDNKNNNYISANEGNALALSAGYNISSGKKSIVYLQNSGLGNLINPALSLVSDKLNNIPIYYMIGWRGTPGLNDEPQHLEQGEITTKLLSLLRIKYYIFDNNPQNTKKTIIEIFNFTKKNKNKSIALLIKKNALIENSKNKTINKKDFTRREAIEILYEYLYKKFLFVATAGYTGRELDEISSKYNLKNKINYFLNVGAMGHSSSLSFGLLIGDNSKKIVCLDGEGSILMHMGALPVIGSSRLSNNLIHVILNNGVHDSVGSQINAGSKTSFEHLAKACGYKSYKLCRSKKDLMLFAKKISLKFKGPVMIEVKVHSEGELINLKRPKFSPEKSLLYFKKNFTSN